MRLQSLWRLPLYSRIVEAFFRLITKVAWYQLMNVETKTQRINAAKLQRWHLNEKSPGSKSSAFEDHAMFQNKLHTHCTLLGAMCSRGHWTELNFQHISKPQTCCWNLSISVGWVVTLASSWLEYDVQLFSKTPVSVLVWCAFWYSYIGRLNKADDPP